jgi:predicted nucleic acid-binding protein
MEEPRDAKEEEQLKNILPLMKAAHKGEIQITVSTMVLAEIRPREPYNKKHFEVIDDLFYRGRSNVRVVAVTPPIARRASELGSAHKALTSPDAIHVATAILESVEVLYTLDGDADRERRRSGKLLGYDKIFGDPKLRIEVPPIPAQGQFLDLLDEK